MVRFGSHSQQSYSSLGLGHLDIPWAEHFIIPGLGPLGYLGLSIEVILRKGNLVIFWKNDDSISVPSDDL